MTGPLKMRRLNLRRQCSVSKSGRNQAMTWDRKYSGQVLVKGAQGTDREFRCAYCGKLIFKGKVQVKEGSVTLSIKCRECRNPEPTNFLLAF